MNLTKRTELLRIPERGSHEWETINQILDAGFLACVGFCVDGQPFVIPTLYGRDGERLYLHGSAASRMLRELETGLAACVTVTLACNQGRREGKMDSLNPPLAAETEALRKAYAAFNRNDIAAT